MWSHCVDWCTEPIVWSHCVDWCTEPIVGPTWLYYNIIIEGDTCFTVAVAALKRCLCGCVVWVCCVGVWVCAYLYCEVLN